VLQSVVVVTEASSSSTRRSRRWRGASRLQQINAWEDDAGSWLHSSLRLITREASALRPRGEIVITRLADIIVIQAIRSWLDSEPEASQGWLAGLRDERVGRALASVHRTPELEWSVATLAKIQ